MQVRDGGLRELFRRHLPMVHWVSLESGMTGRGIPDMNGCFQGAEFWVENKMTTGWTAGLRPEQVGWLSRRSRAGGRCFVAVRRTSAPRLGHPIDELWLVDGCQAEELKDRGLRGVVASSWEGGPARWQWEQVLQTLVQ